MLFAAGFGTRMGALTAQRPKPLIEVAGRPLIDHALELAEAAGISKIVVSSQGPCHIVMCHMHQDILRS